MQISTPEEYQQLKNGQIGQKVESIQILPGANADLIDAHQLALSRQYYSIKVHDKNNNYVHTMPREFASVTGRFVQGGNHLAHLPRDYLVYDIVLRQGAIDTDADISGILTWNSAQEIKIVDNANLAYDLSLRMHELDEKMVLQTIILTVQRHSYKQLDVRLFLSKMDILGYMTLQASPDMRPGEMIEFGISQNTIFYEKRISKKSLTIYRAWK